MKDRLKIVKFIEDCGTVTVPQLQAKFGLDYYTARKIITDMCDKGCLFLKEGAGLEYSVIIDNPPDEAEGEGGKPRFSAWEKAKMRQAVKRYKPDLSSYKKFEDLSPLENDEDTMDFDKFFAAIDGREKNEFDNSEYELGANGKNPILQFKHQLLCSAARITHNAEQNTIDIQTGNVYPNGDMFKATLRLGDDCCYLSDGGGTFKCLNSACHDEKATAEYISTIFSLTPVIFDGQKIEIKLERGYNALSALMELYATCKKVCDITN